MTARKLHIVPASPPSEGKHIGDDLRAHILSRDWSKVLVWGDRQPAVEIADVRRVKRA